MKRTTISVFFVLTFSVLSIIDGQPAGSITMLFNFDECKRFLASKNRHSRFSDGQISSECSRQETWAEDMVRRVFSNPLEQTLSGNQLDWLSGVWNCNDLTSCICVGSDLCENFVKQITSGAQGAFGDGVGGFDIFGRRKRRQTKLRKLSKAIRKEYRMLGDEERRNFHRALNSLKFDKIDGFSKYDLLILYHTAEQSPGAHFGPALLPFHRHLLKHLEIALRQVDPSVSIPYWDSTLDSHLPNPRDSIIWTEEFLGNGHGEVTTGPFKRWVTMEDSQIPHLSPRRRIMRDLGANEFGGLFQDRDVQTVMQKRSFDQLTFCVDPYLELVHGTVHMWVGGHMTELRISPNDPVFFLIHSHVDKVWEDFRQQNQNSIQRETEYPDDGRACNNFHYAESIMKPFKIRNIAGLSNDYTDRFYRFAPSPNCSALYPNCGSPYLFCDLRFGGPRCVSKIALGGNCTGFESQDICYEGVCHRGTCARPTHATGSTTATARTTGVPNPWETWGLRFTSPVTTPSPPSATRRTRKPIRQTTPRPLPTRRRRTRPARLFTTPDIFTRFFKNPTTTPLPTTRNPIAENWQTTTAPKQTSADDGMVWIPIMVLGIRNDGLIRPYLSGTILSDHEDGTVLEGEFTPPSQKPYYTGAAMAALVSPFSTSGRVQAEIHVLDDNGRACAPMCLQSSIGAPWKYFPCIAEVKLDVDPRKSDNIPFSPFKEHARYLNWRGPHSKDPDPFMFMCNAIGARRGADFAHRAPPVEVAIRRKDEGTPRFAAATARGDSDSVTINLEPNVSRPFTADAECRNTHRCCSIWANVGECHRNRWMRDACSRACFVCNAGNKHQDSHESCVDFYAECLQWAQRGHCSSNRNWMEENCRKACFVCNRSTAQLKRLCGARRQDGECRDYQTKCATWASKGECDLNPWWMRENCPLSCRIC